MNRKVRMVYHEVLRFVIRKRCLDRTVGRTKWFNRLVHKEAQWILNNR